MYYVHECLKISHSYTRVTSYMLWKMHPTTFIRVGNIPNLNKIIKKFINNNNKNKNSEIETLKHVYAKYTHTHTHVHSSNFLPHPSII